MSRSRTASLPAFLFALTAAPALAAQTWVATSSDGSLPGTPATVTLEENNSDEVYTSLLINIHGFWRETVVGQDGASYEKLTFPGLQGIGRVGAPDLPAVRANIAVGGQDGGMLLFEGVNFLNTVTYEAMMPLPTFELGEDEEFDPTWDPGPGDTEGTDPVWSYDPAIYESGATWPAEYADFETEVRSMLGPIQGAAVEIYPVSYSPEGQVVTIARTLSVTFSADVSGAQLQEITKPKDAEAAVHFVNWSETHFYWPYNPVQYHSRYLIVAQSMWWDTLGPFVAHKKAQGFETSMVQADPNVDAIRDVIQSWYYNGDPGMDHYALLVGDTNWIPLVLIFEPGIAVRGDDPYGCIGALDQSKEVHVGRISADSIENLGAQLQKIMDYELDPAPGDYHEALLVSHKEEAPEKYTGSHIKVRDAFYSNAPAFVTLFGESGADNQDVYNEINDGVGLVAYRGHGSTTTWSGWNTDDEDLHKNDIPDLTNTVHPVVWSLSCTNSNLNFDTASGQDSISEVWMEAPNGAVAAYGATQTTSTGPNHYLNETLFQVVYHHGITTHAKAIDLAEQSLWLQWPGQKNPWAYLLLGDPSMKIRRGPVLDLGFLSYPEKLTLGATQGILSLTATSSGDTLRDGLVSVYKSSFLAGQPDEVLGSYWIDGNNNVVVPIPVATPGTLYLSISDGDGNSTRHPIDVKMSSAWSDLGKGLPGELGKPRLAGMGTLHGGSPWSLLLTNTKPGSATFLCAGTSQANIPFYGGVLVPAVTSPAFLIPMSTDESGNAVFTGDFPDGIPGGLSLYFQQWVVDASGPLGAVASNAVRGVTPL